MEHGRSISFRIAAAVISIAAVSLVIAVYALLDPARLPFPRCPFLSLTGFKCPGCGSQRALHQALNLNPAGVLHYNAILAIMIPLMLFLLAASLLGSRFPALKRAAENKYLGWAVLALTLLWWVLRNIFGI